MDPNQARELLRRYNAGTATLQEQSLVENWWSQLIETGELQWSEEEREQIRLRMEGKVMTSVSADPSLALRTTGPSHSLGMTRRRWYWAAAAAIIILLTGGYFLLNNSGKKIGPEKVELAKDVEAPKENRAQITLANGEKVYLDSASNGQLAMQGNIKLVKLANGQIEYQTGDGQQVKEVQYNTLFNPKGSKAIDMTLADGSRVWLNSGSSVTYPVAFIESSRKVKITGEAYFEVAHNSTQPFVVTKDAVSVEVLGTHFNVNAFDDENDIKITLLQGSVKVSNATSNTIIKPGQQAILRYAQNDKGIVVKNGVDLDEVMAWKNGRFLFADASIESIMKQVSRWYDVEVVYEGKIPGGFGGDLSRDVPVSKLLYIMEQSNRVHFRIEGKRITVRP